MNSRKCITKNLAFLRGSHGYSQEAVAEKIGVTRQAIAKWENGDTLPDILNCEALAKLYGVSLDSLIHHDQAETGMPIGPKGKHIFGTTKVGERGQIVLPKNARDTMGIKKGDTLMVLGNEDAEGFGIALVPSEQFLKIAELLAKVDFNKGTDHE